MGLPVATPVRGSAYKLSRRPNSRGLGFASWRDFLPVCCCTRMEGQIYGVSLMCPDTYKLVAESWLNGYLYEARSVISGRMFVVIAPGGVILCAIAYT